MGYLDDYKTRVNAYATSPLDSMNRSYEKFINDNFANSPSYRTGTMNGNFIDFLFVSGTNNKNMYGEKEFQFRPSTLIDRGDTISMNSDSWIMMDRNYGNDTSPKATAVICNDNLKWKDASGNVYSYPCATVPYRAIRNIQTDSFSMNLPQGHMFLLVQLNIDTQNIVLKQRFILGSQVYEITGKDDSNYVYNGKGLIYFTVGVTTKNTSSDDFVNRIADNTIIYQGIIPSETSVATTGSNSTVPSNGGDKMW